MEPTIIRVAGVPEPYNLPWHMVMQQGAFAKAGIDLQWHTVPEGTGRMCRMLRAGELDMAVLVTEGAVSEILADGPIRIISDFVVSPLPWGVHVPAQSAIYHPEQIRDVPFAISRKGSGSHLMAMLYADQLGWRPSEEQLVVVNDMEGAAARMAGKSPCVFLWETFVTARYVDAGVMRRVDEMRADWPGFVIVARKGSALDDENCVQALLKALPEGLDLLTSDPRPVERVMHFADFSEERARAWYASVQWRVGTPDHTRIDALAERLKRTGLAG